MFTLKRKEIKKRGGENMFAISMKLVEFVQKRSRVIGVVCLAMMLSVLASIVWGAGEDIEKAFDEPLQKLIKILEGPVRVIVVLACAGGVFWSALREKYFLSFLCGVVILVMMFIGPVVRAITGFGG